VGRSIGSGWGTLELVVVAAAVSTTGSGSGSISGAGAEAIGGETSSGGATSGANRVPHMTQTVASAAATVSQEGQRRSSGGRDKSSKSLIIFAQLWHNFRHRAAHYTNLGALLPVATGITHIWFRDMRARKQKMDEKEKVKAGSGGNGRFWWRKPGEVICKQPQLKPGDTCPNCGQGQLAFDGLFMLVCCRCQRVADSGAFT
jgi:hypothetical protein